MKLKFLLLASLLGMASTAFAAATPAPAAGNSAAPHEPGSKYCSAHAQECKDDAQKFDKWCSGHEEKCTDLKAWAEKHIEYCQAHEKECAERREKMKETFKQWCAKNPDKEHCKAMKEHKDEAEQEMNGDTPPPK